MTRVTDHISRVSPLRARGELAAAWTHLLDAAGQEARQVGRSSRKPGRVARDRAESAALALRGKRTDTPWRWLAAGLAAGLAIGAVGATVLARAARDTDRTGADRTADQARVTTAAIRQRAGAGAEAVREGSRAAGHNAAATARGTAAKVRDKFSRQDTATEPESTESRPESAPED